MYAYVEALQAAVTDRHDALTGQTNALTADNVNRLMSYALEGAGPQPELMVNLLQLQNQIKPSNEMGSIRAILSELRSLSTSLRWQATSGPHSRAGTELAVVEKLLLQVKEIWTQQTQANASLEK